MGVYMIDKYILLKQTLEEYNRLSLEYRMSIKSYFKTLDIDINYIIVNPVKNILKIGYIALPPNVIDDFNEAFGYELDSVELSENRKGDAEWITVFIKKE